MGPLYKVLRMPCTTLRNLGSSLLGLGECSLLGLALGVPLSGLLLALGLVGGDDICVAPAELGSELAEIGVLAARLQAGDTECVGHDHLLDLVEGGRDALNGLDTLESGGATVPDVGEHATHQTHEHVSGGFVVEWALPRVGVHALVALHEELQLVADVRARDDEVLAADNDNLLAKQSLLSDEGGEAAKQVVPRIDHGELLKRHVCAIRPKSPHV